MRWLMVPAALSMAAGISHADPRTMSLHEALDYAHAHQPSLAAAKDRVEVARAQAQVPRAALGPRVVAAAEMLGGTANNTTASYATIGALDVARVGGTPANADVSWSPEVSTLAGVSLHQSLYDSGRLETAGDAFDALARAEAEVARSVELDLDLYVEDAFYAVTGSKAILAPAEAAVTRSRAHRDLADANVRAQMRPPIDLTRAEADLARFEVERARAAGALAIAQAALAAAIGATDASIDAGADDVSPAETGTVDNAPEIAAARARVDAQHLFTRSIRDELRPELGFSAEVTSRAGSAAVANPTPTGGGFVPDVPNWDALVVVTWPLFDRSVDARARASERQERVRRDEVEAVSQQLRAVVARARIEVETAKTALPALQRAVDAAAANQEQAEARFGAGLATAVELSDSEALLVDAQIQLAVGNVQLSRARARAARALGGSK